MQRQETLRVFFEELRNHVPDRDCLICATRAEVLRMAKEIDFEPLDEFLQCYDLELKKAEIPNDLWFELVLYIILNALMTNWEWLDKEIFDFNDEGIEEKIKEIKNILDNNNAYICDLSIDKFIEYAVSGKPNF